MFGSKLLTQSFYFENVFDAFWCKIRFPLMFLHFCCCFGVCFVVVCESMKEPCFAFGGDLFSENVLRSARRTQMLKIRPRPRQSIPGSLGASIGSSLMPCNIRDPSIDLPAAQLLSTLELLLQRRLFSEGNCPSPHS